MSPARVALAAADDETALRRAHDELQALGARPAIAIVARRLRERGARGVPRGPRRQTRANPAGLTARELSAEVRVVLRIFDPHLAERLTHLTRATLAINAAANFDELITVAATGISCNFSTRFSAVTTISSSPTDDVGPEGPISSAASATRDGAARACSAFSSR